MVNKKFYSLLVIAIWLLGCAAGSLPKASKKEIILGKTTFSFDQGTYPSDLDVFPEYHIIPGDVLDVLFQIHSWKPSKKFKIGSGYTVSIKFLDVPELDQTQTVLPDGTIVLPYVGKYKVFNKTIEQITQELKRMYSRILRKPEIYVIVPEFQTRIKALRQDLHTAPRGLSKLITVRPDGYVTFPLIGNVFVARRTIPELNKILNEKYDKILPGLHVDLFLHKHAGSVVYVLGEVTEPGAYQIKKPLNVIQVLTFARGFTHEADLSSVVVFRKHERKIVGRILNLNDTLSLKNNVEFFFVKPDDLIYVPRKRLSSLAQAMREVGNILFFRGWSFGFGYSLNRP